VSGYLEVWELKQTIGGNKTSHDDDYERAIAAATRQIDRWTGRRFIRDEVAVTRPVRAMWCDWVCVGDFTDPADVTVETDLLGNGTWVEWEPDQWQPGADDKGNGRFVRLDGEPWRWVGATNTAVRSFPVCDRDSRARVKVTTRWGWDEVPDPVSQACLELAILYFQPGNRAPELVGTAAVEAAKCLLMDYAVEGGTLCMDPLAP